MEPWTLTPPATTELGGFGGLSLPGSQCPSRNEVKWLRYSDLRVFLVALGLSCGKWAP